MVQRITIQRAQQQATVLHLQTDQVHYLRRVLRLGEGDRFIAQDGQGQQWMAILTAIPDQARVIERLGLPDTACSLAPLRLIAALPKGNSFDAVVRQATELGVTHIYPVISDRTLLKPSRNKLARWRRISQEASEQSERVSVPEIFEPTAVRQCMAQSEAQLDWSELRYICVARRHSPHLLSKLQQDLSKEDPQAVTLMIGPEGGWTSDEITDANMRRYEVVALGSVILRSVTASITALSLVTAARELLI
ncbi:MAG: 16S rRNA (uracil(1498)-N(3))-methyltransferase [Cyanobacteria bacterium J06588_5]